MPLKSKSSKVLLATSILGSTLAFQNCSGRGFVAGRGQALDLSSSARSHSEFTDVLYVGNPGQGSGSDLSLSVPVAIGSRNDTLQISSGARYKGAISSFIFRGVEFIDRTDHGRELQSALVFDMMGECYNPTEAGTTSDHMLPTGSSRLLSSNITGNTFETTVDAAFWLPPGTDYGRPCWAGTTLHAAQNTVSTANYLIHKTVNVGFAGIPNILEYKVSVSIPQKHRSGQFEVLTGYMPAGFSKAQVFDLSSGDLKNIIADSNGHEQPFPVMLSTADDSSAMAIYTLPKTDVADFNRLPSYGYWAFAEENVVKWNTVMRKGADYTTGDLPAGNYSFTNFVAFGTKAETLAALKKIICMYPPLGYTIPSDMCGQPVVVSPTPARNQITTIPPAAKPYSTLGKVDLHRFYNQHDHFLTSVKSEGANAAGYVYEGVAFRIFASPQAGLVPLYRCYIKNNSHFVSTATNCEGEIREGTYGYIAISSFEGSIPVYRFTHPTDGTKLDTTNQAEGIANKYTLDGVIGYVAQ